MILLHHHFFDKSGQEINPVLKSLCWVFDLMDNHVQEDLVVLEYIFLGGTPG